MIKKYVQQPKKLALKNLSRFTRGKVLVAFLAAGIAIASSWVITRVVFSDMADSVTGMSEPNEKLLIVNRLLEQVSSLDQLQRVQAIKAPNTHKHFLSETKEIRLTLDTLQNAYSDNPPISRQIDSMRSILAMRDQVYIEYATLRADLLNNSHLSSRLKNISGMVQANARLRDSSVTTTETNITTTAAPKEEEQESFWKRLFGKKKKEKKGRQFVREEKNVRVDTLTVARQDSIVEAIESAVERISYEQTARTGSMLLQELSLINNGNSLVNRLWSILHKIQEEEINRIRANKDEVIGYLEISIKRAGTIMLVLFLIIAVTVFLVITDINRNNAYREQLRLAKENAEHLSVMKQRFLSNMSHEIRTPLQSIIGFAEQVKNNPHPEPKMLEAIHASSGHLLQIVNEVLDYSRIISGKFTIENHPFNLHRLLEDVAANMRLQAEAKHLRFVYKNTTDATLNYLGDDFRMRQVLYNLLGNAIKFTTRGEVGLLADPGLYSGIKLVVSDTGTGIPAKDLQRIFNEFEQTDTSIARRFGGTGLGLSICKALVENMGGTIDIESKEGSGTQFTLMIPLKETTAQVENTREPVQEQQYLNIPTIVVEDDPFILQLCDAILTKHGITHACYASAEEALKASWKENTALVFSDIRLPGLTGSELVQELKRQKRKATFVALTAQVLPEEKQHLLGQGFDGILAKPFHEQELLSFYTTGQHQPATPAPASRINLELLHQMSMGDEELLLQHLNRFIESTRADLVVLQEALEKQKQEAVYEVAHKLAGRTGQIGAAGLMNTWRGLERDLIEPATLAALTPRISDALEETTAVLAEVKHLADRNGNNDQ